MRSFATPKLGARYAIGRAALRVLLGAQLRLEPHAVPLGVGPHGKPRLTTETDVEFNVSHCGGIGAIAMTAGMPIGVDIERRHIPQHSLAIARRIFDEYETEVIATLPADLAGAAFLRCWTGKEAVLKALGLGLTRPPRHVVVEPDPRLPPSVIRAGEGINASEWALRELGALVHDMMLMVAMPAPNTKCGGVHPIDPAKWLG